MRSLPTRFGWRRTSLDSPFRRPRPKPGVECQTRPTGHRVCIIEGVMRDGPVGHHHQSPASFVSPLRRTSGVKLCCADRVGLQPQLVSILDGNDHTLKIHSLSAEHPPNRDRSERREEFAYVLVIHNGVVSLAIPSVGKRLHAERDGIVQVFSCGARTGFNRQPSRKGGDEPRHRPGIALCVRRVV